MGHYYTKNEAGVVEPRHFVPNASRPGELRPTRVTDAKKNGWHVSVTTVQDMLNRKALNDWRTREHLKTVFELGSLEGFSALDEFISVIEKKTQEALDKAPQQGTDIHDSLEKYLRGEPVPKEHELPCKNAMQAVNEYCGKQDWIAEHSFTHPMGYGGKIDLHSPSFTVDWKSKNDATKWKPGKMHYPEMCQQLAAYRVGVNNHDSRCLNVFVCIPDGKVEIHEWKPEELDREFANFTDLLRIWLRNANYIPG